MPDLDQLRDQIKLFPKDLLLFKSSQGYVKIAKWNDANFWAMKQAAEKSHRTLHKFVRRYEVRDMLFHQKNVV